MSTQPSYTGSQKVNYLRKGHDIRLQGAAAKHIVPAEGVSTFAVQPFNFRGIVPIPKLNVNPGDKVLAGDVLLIDKKRPELKFVAPVSGEIESINRGEKRAIKEIVIKYNGNMEYKSFNPPDLKSCERAELVSFLQDAGVWPLIRQRPFNMVPDTESIPKNIFISTFDTAPLAPDLSFVMNESGESFQAGLEVLRKLTNGKVHLGLDANRKNAPSSVFRSAQNVEKHWFRGKHPAGNVGVQIHHIDPINQGDKVWTLNVQDVALIGDLFVKKIFNSKRVVALTGSEVGGAKYIETYMGANICQMIRDKVETENIRIISGDVLSGEQKFKCEFLNAFDDQITVIPEGNQYELFGWLAPGVARPSISRTFLNFIFKNREFKVTTNSRGEKRAFVVTGDYESVLPMNIYPQHLMKAILIKDYELMEGLGIYEIEDEDIAICEFACLSKQNLQQILRQGQELLIAQA
ncbi:MAG TPA: NADH:ubiquinone reductase (Na(+)-transporting) subunit A [Saprospirales bacterium]|nr:NADH:ubiquinone reductase (Na(+)-transporting) subunit A [Saprospirales bacterium]HAY70295.1 NADH:ubiquinone reductase (Na(+)-transporting) subunit A [Saprospirales bacterium]HRQ28993.1 Na(+)-translocating NADH-quinone reductase subunit A [Saprospiraceae bacterium]